MLDQLPYASKSLQGTLAKGVRAPSARMELLQGAAILLALFRGINLSAVVLSLYLSSSRSSIDSIAS